MQENLKQMTDYLSLISNCSNRGLMISEIILKNISDGKISDDNFVQLSIADIVKSALNEYAFTSNDEKSLIYTDLKDDFNFTGDETLMIFVLFNLLKNSLCYKANIKISLDSKHKHLYFKDDGIGIDENKLPFVFDDFFTSNKKGGTGLGLPFCKRIMQAFGGDIRIKSIKGKGVEFCLKFTD